MIIRFGFVAMSLLLENASPSKTITYKSYQKLTSDETRLYHLRKLTEENLVNTLRILIHAHAHDVQLYRITSKLVPLATHQEVIDWDYTLELADYFQKIKDYIHTTGMRISAHPDHLNKAKATFESNFSTLPQEIKDRVILENDDKSYTASETLGLCEKLHLPMVFDVHHHLCNSDGLSLSEILSPIFDTWEYQNLPPKVHYSSPKSISAIRSHADNINSEEFYKFLIEAKELNRNFDVMLEAKNKDTALINLMVDLKNKEGIKFIDGAIIEL